VNFDLIDRFPAALVDAFAPRDLNAGTLPILYKRQFHVRDHSQDSDHHATHVAPSRDIGLKNTQRRAPGIQLMNQI
jgi:cytochrome c1